MAEIDLNVITSWSILNDKRLKDAVTCARNLCDNEDEVEDTVSLDSCVQLYNDENNGDKCTLTLKDFQAGMGIAQLIVISEARKIELYSEEGEYILTSSSEFVTEIDDFVVYKANILLPSPLESCIVKLLSLRIPTEMWLYGLRVAVQPIPSTRTITSNMDINKILHRINQSDDKMSDKAKNFAQLLMSYPTNADCANANASLNTHQMMQLFKNFNVSDNKSNGVNERGDERNAEDGVKRSSPNDKIKIQPPDLHGSDLNSLLTNIVRREVCASEERLWCRMEKHLNELEMRLMEHTNQMGKLMMGLHLKTQQGANSANK